MKSFLSVSAKTSKKELEIVQTKLKKIDADTLVESVGEPSIARQIDLAQNFPEYWYVSDGKGSFGESPTAFGEQGLALGNYSAFVRVSCVQREIKKTISESPSTLGDLRLLAKIYKTQTQV